jgi:hypothetical protein
LPVVPHVDLVLTAHDPAADFAALRTFSMPDSLAEIVADSSSRGPLDHEGDSLIVAKLKEEFTSRGYVFEPDPAANPPDFLVLAAGVASAGVDAYRAYDWWPYWSWWQGWDFYPGGFDAGWRVDYPYGAAADIAYDRGTLLIDIWDVRSPDPASPTLHAAWTAAIRGLLSGSTAGIEEAAGPAIERAFQQSPYLRR